MNKKQVLCGILCCTLGMSIMAGCSSNKASQKKESSKSEKIGTETETVTLKMWTIATESDSFYNAFEKAIEDYEKANPNIKLEMETFENESYKTKIKSAVAANELPDIYFTWGGGFSESFVQAGKALELDTYYEAYKDELPISQLKYATYGDKIYGITYTTPISGIFYNKAIFEKLGLKVPSNWDELLDACSVLKEANITPFGTSVKDAWVLAMLNDALTLKCVGDKKLAAAFSKQNQTYQDAGFIDAAKKLETLITEEAFNKDATGVSNDEAVASFFAGKSAMYVTGSWLGGQISGLDNADEFDFAPFPVFSDGVALTDFMGGSVDMLMVNPDSKNKDIAVKAAFDVARSVSKYSCLDGAGIAAWKQEFGDEELNAITKTMTNYVNNGTSFTVWSGSLMSADDYATYLTLLQAFFVGNMDSQQFVDEMDKKLNK